MDMASRLMDSCLLGIMDKDEKILYAYTSDEIKQLISNHPQSILFYNQSPQAIEIKDKIDSADGQQHIEIFQDTVGVFGLRAYRLKGKIQTPVTLELSDD